MYNQNYEFNQPELEMDELNPEYFGEYNQEFENSNEYQGEILNQEGTFSEASQMELASELLSVTNEAELDRFLGKLFKKAVGGASRFLKSGAGRSLGGFLKGIAKKALPMAGAALGSAFLPGVGTALGSALGKAASNMFELELEGLSQEDQEFEISKAFVRFAGNAAREAISSTPDQSPVEIARRSVTIAARRYAPGLLIRKGSYTGRGYYSGRGYRPYRRFNNGVGVNVNTSGVYNAGAGDNTIGANNSLIERLLRLEDLVRNLSSQLQTPPSMSGGNVNATSSDKEFYRSW